MSLYTPKHSRLLPKTATHTEANGIGRRDRIVSGATFLGLFSLYLAVSRHQYVAYDAQAMVAVGRNLVDHLSLRTTGAFNDYFHLNTPYSNYGIAVSVLVVPVYALSKVVGHLGLLISLVNPVVVAATAVVVYYIGRSLCWRRSLSVAAAIAFGALTMAFQATTELLSEPGVALCEALMVLAVIRWQRGWKWGPLLLGVASAAVIQFRQDSIFTVWIGLLAVPLFVPWRVIVTRRNLAMLASPVVVSLAFLMWYNELRWGSLFATSYNHQGFHTPLGRGIEGLLVSPGKSIFVFNPLAILGAVGLVFLFWRNRPLAILSLLLIVPRLIFFAKWDSWEGGVTWGPRFLMPVMFLFVLGAIEVLNATRWNSWSGTAARVVFAFLAVVSAAVGFLSVRVPYEQWWQTASSPQLRAEFETDGRLLRHPTAPNAVMDSLDFTVRASPIRGNLLLLEKGSAEMAPALWREKEPIVGWLLLSWAGSCLLIATILAFDLRASDEDGESEALPEGRSYTSASTVQSVLVTSPSANS